MTWNRSDLEASLEENPLTVLVQCDAAWFPVGPWDRLTRVDRDIIDLQRQPGHGPRDLLRVLPYDYPPGSPEDDMGRLHDWLTRVSLITAPDSDVRVTIRWSTGRPYPPDGLYTGEDAVRIRSELLPSLLKPEEIRWLISDSTDHDPFWSG